MKSASLIPSNSRRSRRRSLRPSLPFEAKLRRPEEVARWIGALARPLVFTNGVFDLLHRGHVTYLARARALGASL
ncbi:MAG: D-glycero-beta-D-manno-heptose 1-phosphate adenylyltransferase, partial [Clostridia bacterium]